MRIIAAVFLLTATFYVLADAKGSGTEPQVPGRRFKVRPLRHSRQYYKRMLGFLPENDEVPLRKNAYGFIFKAFANVTPPASFNWAEKPGVVTPAKHQGGCGSCYAFAAVAATESMMAIWNDRESIDLSEQQIIDCSRITNGCDGGTTINVYRYLLENRGVCEEKVYPYTAKNGICRNTTDKLYAGDITFAKMPIRDEKALKKVLYTMGPIAIAIHSDQDSFFRYAGGIYDDPVCTTDPVGIDHGVQLVGYGEENGTPYWIIKNSWGKEWGENGYMRMSRGVRMCRIGDNGSIPVATWLSKRLAAKEDVRHRYRVD